MGVTATRLRRIVRKARASGALGEVFASEELVREYLFRTHCVARASVPLMKTALRLAKARAKADVVAAGIVDYLAEHIEEEKDHERWIANDLASLGVSAEEIARRVPPPSIAAGVGAQYYWVQHFHPVALFGYMAVLESSAPSVAGLERALRRSPVPKAAFRTIIWHAERDLEHSRELTDCVDALPLSAEQEGAVEASALATLQLLERNGAELLGAQGAVATLLAAASRRAKVKSRRRA